MVLNIWRLRAASSWHVVPRSSVQTLTGPTWMRSELNRPVCCLFETKADPPIVLHRQQRRSWSKKSAERKAFTPSKAV
eukprot:2363600-Rhodomonas_salina.3